MTELSIRDHMGNHVRGSLERGDEKRGMEIGWRDWQNQRSEEKSANSTFDSFSHQHHLCDEIGHEDCSEIAAWQVEAVWCSLNMCFIAHFQSKPLI